MRIFLVGFISFLVIGCSSVSPGMNSSPNADKWWKVTEVWGEHARMFGGVVHFEVVARSEAQVGGECRFTMWAGEKAYDEISSVVNSNDLDI